MANELARRLLERVKQLREERALSQEEFAERAGLDPKHYQQVEAKRKIDFRMSTLEKLARGLDLEPWELLVPEDLTASVAEMVQVKYGRRPGRRTRKK